ncbi:helix-turn-helix transcriptional regulator [Halobellus sp. EA9]|uniref:helix-turn-helix transcriptional regulator n=1 Tax=Halobellus sp. EA9 TaxID=3421647 RepID=UPI003EBC6B97
MTAREDIAFLAGSELRVEALFALRSETATPTELAERCSCARETAQRTISAFVDRGWAEKVSTAEGYRLTRAGGLVASGYEDFERCVAVSKEYREFLVHLSGVDPDLSCRELDALTLTRATTQNPHAPINRFREVVGDEPVEEFFGITPIVSRMFNEAAARVIGSDTRIDLVIDESVLTASASEFPEALERAERLDQFTLYVSPETLEFGLMLVDGHAYLGAYDDGTLVASVDGRTDAFREWAADTFERIREQSKARL